MNAPNFNHSSLCDVLDHQVSVRGDAVAYTFLSDGETNEQHMTYAELQRRAGVIAGQLMERTQPGDRALLTYQPGLAYIAAYFGCLYAGVVAVPIYPPRFNARSIARFSTVVGDAGAKIALTEPSIMERIGGQLEKFPVLGEVTWLVTAGEETLEPARREVKPGDLAFLQYTSGSTSAPKGVMVTHANLVHNLELIRQSFGQTPDDLVVIWLPPYHDMGLIGGILQPLYTGYRAVLMSPFNFLQRPLRWLQAITRYKATTSGGPNFAYDLCVAKIKNEERAELDLSSLKVAFNGAEPVRAETLQRFSETFAPCGFQARAFFPCYGLAETTLFVTGSRQELDVVQIEVDADALAQGEIRQQEQGRTLVGSGLADSGLTVAIADPEQGIRVQPGRVGEIWVKGQSIAAGYWQRQEQTQATFDSWLGENDGPYLRTGDLGFLADGELYVTGRIKDLIIIRGRNLYPQDVERAAEVASAEIAEGASAAFAVDRDGEESLVLASELKREAYRRLRGDSEAAAALAETLREAIFAEFQVQPEAVLLLGPGRIPKTSSGKIQRYACRESWLGGKLEVVGQLAGGETETAEIPPMPHLEPQELEGLEGDARRARLREFVLNLVGQLLKLPLSTLNEDRSLGALGLDSLKAMELKNELELAAGVELNLVQLLEGPAIGELIEMLLTAPRTSGDTGAGQILEGPQPLSHGQRAMWFLARLAPESAAYHVPCAVRIRSRVDEAAMARALKSLVTRNPQLRTTFTMGTEGPVQTVSSPDNLDFQVLDGTAWKPKELEAQLGELARTPFDLETDMPLRARLIRSGNDQYVLSLVMHHIVTDFWSLAVIVEELGKLYEGEAAGTPAELPGARRHYGDYVAWQERLLDGERGKQLHAFWSAELGGEVPVLDLPTDHPRPTRQTFNGRVFNLHLNQQLSQGLKRLAQERRTTLFTVLMGAYQLLLGRYAGQRSFTVGTLSAGRGNAADAGIVGYFVNPITVGAELNGNQSFAAFLDGVRDRVLAALAHDDYPFDTLVEKLRPERDQSRSPLFQAMFVMQKAYRLDELGLTPFALNQAGARLDWAGLTLESMALEWQAAQFDLQLTAGETDTGLIASFEYNTDLFERGTIARLATHFENLLEVIATAPDRPLSQLSLAAEAERAQLLRIATGETTEPLASNVVALFEQAAARNPQGVAVSYEGQHLTYAELEARSARLARLLVSRGIGPETPVTLLVAQSLELVIGTLAVLRAGGAYVPLDPQYPVERITFLQENTGAPLLLAQKDLVSAELREALASEIIALEDDLGADDAVLLPSLDGANLACIIYTSGSTGTPKGVLLHHAAVANLIHSFIHSYQPAHDDKMLPLTALSSASFVGEVLPILCAGGSLVLSRMHGFLEFDKLFELIRSQRVTMISTVPAVLSALNARVDDLPHLRLILSGGEALTAGAVDRLLAAVKVVNGYGLTETTICSTYDHLDRKAFEAGGAVSMGRPIINTTTLVLDAYGNPQPQGIPGELFVGGHGITRGYLANPRQTAERFVPDPFGDGARLYRTGDVVKARPDGSLVFLHRADNQVKIRGFRIELGEIEARIKAREEVVDAVVVVREDSGDKLLAAYVVLANAETDLAGLRRDLGEELPHYMVPAVFTALEALPLTPNGKVNVRALPKPVLQAAKQAYSAPQNEVERTLTTIWQEHLKLERVGIHDNFFDIGGHSLLAAKVHEQVKKAFPERGLTLVDLFKFPTIASLAHHISEGGKGDAEKGIQRREAAAKRNQAVRARGQMVKERMRNRAGRGKR